MDRKKLTAVRRLAEKTGMLQLYAEQVVAGRMSLDEAMSQSFDAIRRGERDAGPVGAPVPRAAARPEVCLTFRLEPDAAEIVLRALEIHRRRLAPDTTRDQALVALAKDTIDRSEGEKR